MNVQSAVRMAIKSGSGLVLYLLDNLFLYGIIAYDEFTFIRSLNDLRLMIISGRFHSETIYTSPTNCWITMVLDYTTIQESFLNPMSYVNTLKNLPIWNITS